MTKYKWRLYADENIEKDIVEALRKAKIDVLWVVEEKSLRKQKDDFFHYKKSNQLGRFFLTKDEEFWPDRKYPLHKSPGVIIISSQDKDIGALLIILLRKLISQYNPAQEPIRLEGIKIRLSEEGIYLRALDPDTQKKVNEFWKWEDF